MPKEQRIIPPDEQLRAVRHVDPTGRFALGRKFAFRTFTMASVGDGRILLCLVEFVEKHQMEAWRRAVRKGETPPPPNPSTESQMNCNELPPFQLSTFDFEECPNSP